MKSFLSSCKRFAARYRPTLICAILFALALFLFLWPRIVISVKPGELGVLYARLGGGTVMSRSYGEGLHLIAPWNIMYIYDTRVQEVSRSVEVLTGDGLMINLETSLRYQADRDNLPTLHRDVGPNYPEKLVFPIMTSAIRWAAGTYSPDDLSSNARAEVQRILLENARTQIRNYPVKILGVAVKSITFPERLRRAIEDKLVAKQRYLRYEYILQEEAEEARRKAIEGGGIQEFQRLVNERLTDRYLTFEGVRATKELAASNNAKIVVIGGGKDGLPVILNTGSTDVSPPESLPPETVRPLEPEPLREPRDQDEPGEAPLSPLRPPPPPPVAPSAPGVPPGPPVSPEGATGWLGPGESVMDFLYRMDKTLLNSRRAALSKRDS